MGAYLEIHLGPYLIVKNKYIDSTKEEILCRDASCSNHGKTFNGNFCFGCGQAFEKTNTPIKKRFTMQRFINDNKEWVDELSFPHDGGTDIYKDKTIAICNGSNNRPVEYDIDNNSGVYPIPTTEEIEADMQWFKTEYKEIFDAVTKEFGEENMKFEWGLIVHYN